MLSYDKAVLLPFSVPPILAGSKRAINSRGNLSKTDVRTEEAALELSEFDGRYPALFFDVTNSEQHVFNTKVPEQPRVYRSVLSDHIYRSPNKVQITGVINDQAGLVFPRTDYRFTDKNAVYGNTDSAYIAPLGIVSRSIDFLGHLNRLRINGVVMRINTGLFQYRNMVITNIQVDETPSTLTHTVFVVMFKEIISANTRVRTSDFSSEYNAPPVTQGQTAINPVDPTTVNAVPTPAVG